MLPLVLTGLGLGFALIPLAQGKMFFHWDNAQQHYAQTVFLQEGLRQGTIPQWWPNVGLGFPTTAEGQAAHYHPIRLVCALLFSASAAMMWEVALYFAIAGLSTYFFLREFQLHRTACFLGAVSQMFSGFAMIYVRNIALHRSFCLLPLAMLCAERFVRRGSVRSPLAASLVVGMQFLAGHPSFAIVTVVATAVYAALRAVQRSWKQDATVREAARALLGRVGAWGCVAVLGLGLAAMQVLPTLLHTQQSQRQGGLSFEFATESQPATPRGLGQLVFPYAYTQGDWLPERTWWGSNFNPVPSAGMYSGVLCVVLAPVALWWRRRWPDPVLPLAICFGVAIGLALGAKAPFFPALWSLPGMNGLRFPSRFLLWAAFCLSCLAALGIHRLIALGRTKTRPMRRLAPLVVLAIVLFTLGGALWLRLPGMRSGVAISLGLFATAFVLVSLVATSKNLVHSGVLFLIVCLALGDLWLFRWRGAYSPAIPIGEALKASDAVEFLKLDKGPFRVLSLIATEDGAFTNKDLRDYVQADLSTIWGVDSADVYLSLFLKKHFAVRRSVVRELRERPESARSLAGFMGALNVKYVVAPIELNLAGWERAHAGGQTAVWKNPLVLPRAFLVGRVTPQQLELREEWRLRSNERLEDYRRAVSDWGSRAVDAQILDHIMAQRLDYAVTAEVAGAEHIKVAGLEGDAMARTIAEGPHEIRLSVSAPQPALLVIANSFYPGWTAQVNGRPTRIFQTNWLTMGVTVPAGQSEVMLRYSTPGFREGLIISGILLVVVACLAFRPEPLQRLLQCIEGAPKLR